MNEMAGISAAFAGFIIFMMVMTVSLFHTAQAYVKMTERLVEILLDRLQAPKGPSDE